MLPSMGRPAKEAASPSAFAPALLRYVGSRGGDASMLALQLGKDDAAIEADELPMTATLLGVLLGAASQMLGEPHLALRLAHEVQLRRYDAVALAARAARTPREVLALVARYAPLVFPQLEARVGVEVDEVRISARISGHPRGLGHAVDEYVLAFVLGACRRAGAEVVPSRVWLSCARPSTIEPLSLAFGTHELSFGHPDFGLALPFAIASQQLPGGDPVMLATAQHLASFALASAPRAGSFATTVAARVEAALPSDIDADTVAAALHMSARTLQRRLEDERTRFSEVVDAVREKLARKLVLDPELALSDVAFRVGFSDAATFSRAFKRWTGLPPGAFRRR
jgi:AraC-like DNA-binding protein